MRLNVNGTEREVDAPEEMPLRTLSSRENSGR